MEQKPVDFRQLGEHSSERIVVFDAGFRYAYVNPAFERLVGMHRDEIIGRPLAELFSNLADSERVAHYERAMRERVVVEFDAYCPRWDRWDHVRCVPESGGGLIVFARNNAPDAPRRERAEHRLQRLFDSRVVGVIYWDLDTGRITDANDAFLSMVRYTRDDLTAGRLDFRAMTPPEWTVRNEQGVADIREHGAAPTYEKEYFRKDGSRVPILIGGTRFEESGNEGFSYILDITERKQLEREQQSLLAEARAHAEREALINQIGDGIRQSLAPEEIERIAVAALGNALSADRCYLMAIDLPTNSVAIARDWCTDGVPSMAGQHRISDMGVDLAELFASGETLVVPDALPESEGRLSDRNAANNERVGVSSFLNVPFYDGNRLVGALGVAMAGGKRDWAPDEVTLAETVAGQLRSVLEAARLQRRERNIARQLQQALQPPAPVRVLGLRLASHYSAALGEAEVGGDFYDTFPLNDTRSALVVADLSGKGLDAASQVASVRNQLRYALYTADLDAPSALATVVERLNGVLARHELLTGFATIFVAIWDDATGTLTYVNAGQEPALIWRATTGVVDLLPPTGPVLGGFIGGAFTQNTAILAPGDVWIAFSDGMTEIGPSRKELLGIEGVIPLFRQSCATHAADPGSENSPEPILTRLITAVESFARGTGMRDDLCTLIGVRRANGDNNIDAPPDDGDQHTMDQIKSDERVNADPVGSPPPPPDATDIGVLQPLTAALLECVTPTEVIEVVIGQGLSALGAEAGLVVLIREQQDAPDYLEIVGSRGYSPEVMTAWGRFPLADSLPLSDAVRERTPVFFTNRAAMEARYPEMFRQGPTHAVKASVSLPLVARGRAFGGLHFSFPDERESFAEADHAFLLEATRQCALALDRALLLQELEESRQRQEYLGRASALLAESLDYQTTLDAIARLAVPNLCDWAAVDMINTADENGPLLNLAVAHVNPNEVAWVRAAQQRFPVDRSQKGQPVVHALTTGETVFLPDIPEEILLAAARDEEHLRLIRRLDLRSYVCVPLVARGKTLGAVTFASNRASGRVFTPQTVTLVEELARRAAVAVDNARLYADAQREATERREAEGRFQFMANSAPVLIWTSGTDGRCDWVNDPWLHFTGRTMAQEIGDGWTQGIHPDDLAHHYPIYLDSLRAHHPFTIEYRLRRHDSEYRWLLTNGVPVFDGKDEDRVFKGFIGSCIDITDMKQSQIEREGLVSKLRDASRRQRRFLKEMLAGFTEGRLRLCFTPAELPAPLTPRSDALDLSPDSLRLLRKQIEAVTEGLNFPKERLADLLTAAHEAAMNAVRHGGGGTARIHGDQETGRIQVWITDNGPGIAEEMIHRAVEQGFTTGGFGQGFFYMQSCSDRLYLLSVAESGTTVVLEMDRTPPNPHWLNKTG